MTSMPISPRGRARRSALAVAALVAWSMAACSSGGDGGSAATTAAPPSTEAPGSSVDDSVADSAPSPTEPTPDTEAPVVTALIDVSVSPGVTPGLEGALQDVTERSCTKADGNWTSTGTVANAGTVAVDYRVYTAFMSPSDEMLALVQADVNGVAPGAEATWEKSAAIGDVDDVSCVLRVERNPMAAPAASTP